MIRMRTVSPTLYARRSVLGHDRPLIAIRPAVAFASAALNQSLIRRTRSVGGGAPAGSMMKAPDSCESAPGRWRSVVEGFTAAQ
jgi:hypothetical protein